MMPQPTLLELTNDASDSKDPRLVSRIDAKLGGVDPLGLRQINFDLMDEILPGLNNVARHIRPFVVVTWAWRRGAYLAQKSGNQMIKVKELHDFVDRIEVVFVLSQMLRGGNIDLPGTEYLAPWLGKSRLTFGGSEWEQRRKARAYSTALSAPVNYGPGLKSLGWLVPHPNFSEILLPSSDTYPAVDALEETLRPALHHDAFSRLGNVNVTQDQLREWGELWALDQVSAAEAAVMRKLLIGNSAPLGRRLGTALMLEAAAFKKRTETDALRATMTGAPSRFRPSKELLEIRDKWRGVQVRQLFRLSLESLLYWMMAILDQEGPLSIDALVRSYLEVFEPCGNVESADWLQNLITAGSGPTELMDHISEAFASENYAGLARNIASGLAFCLAEPPPTEQRLEQPERLPLSRARKEAAAHARLSVPQLLRHVFESWVLAQHAYWSVGRALADARAGGRTLLRLRIVLDEGGWALTPGAQLGNAPRPTPDRLNTAISLAKECSLFETGSRG